MADKRRRRPEWYSIVSHIKCIHKGVSTYAGMPIYSKWDSKTGGSYRIGEQWVIANLGCRPAKDYDLHIIDRRIGFMPGNLKWVSRTTHQREEMRNRLLVDQRRLAIEVANSKFDLSLTDLAAHTEPEEPTESIEISLKDRQEMEAIFPEVFQAIALEKAVADGLGISRWTLLSQKRQQLDASPF
jgi:hypothetical protein